MIEVRRPAEGPDARRRSRAVLFACAGLRNHIRLGKFFSIVKAGGG